MALEPFAQRRIVLGRGLDLAQGGELRLGGGMLALRRAQRFGRRRALLFDRASSACRASKPRSAALTPSLQPGHRDSSPATRPRRARPASAARCPGARGAAPAPGTPRSRCAKLACSSCRRLFGLHQLAARCVQRSCAARYACSACGRRALSASSFFFGLCDLLLRFDRPRRPDVQRWVQLRALLAPRGKLGAALGVLALEPVARLLGVAQLGFVARYLGVGRVERACACSSRRPRRSARRARSRRETRCCAARRSPPLARWWPC